MEYFKRDILPIIASRMKHDPVIVITGARQTGKTTLCEFQLPEALDLPFTYISFDDPDERYRFQKAAVSILETIETPLVILDEVQKIPSIFDPLKLVIDRHRKIKGGIRKTFILTGSSQLLLLKNIRETLAGRAALCHMYPLSLHELTGETGTPLLTELWQKNRMPGRLTEGFYTLSSDRIRNLVRDRDKSLAWGGYPPVWSRKEPADKLNWLKDYRKTYLERDISDIGQVADIDMFAAVQKLLCSRTANILSISEVARDVSLAVNTVKRYLNLLNISFQCFLLPPYFENTGKRLIKSPKLYFPDVGLNRAILGDITINKGASYETWVFSEFVKWKQLQPVELELFFYRTSAGRKIDFLIAGEGRIIPVEVKANDKATSADGRNIEAFIKEHRGKAKMGIIVYQGREIAEVRKNIWAVPDWYLFGAEHN
ncbi:MAG: ATP-binding protein [Deltaproteobacteria bacterium]|nr:ATP-binding protein [Deltaproteobacteria bacterium]